MSLALFFWIAMLICLVFVIASSWGNFRSDWRARGWLLLFAMIAVLGWQAFGAPIK